MTITKEWLKQHLACEEGIRFFERNFTEPLDTDSFRVVKDYEGFFWWVRAAAKRLYEYDDSGNVVKATLPDGDARLYEYIRDKKDRLVRITRDGETVGEIRGLD